MELLLTNDDGLEADGLRALAEAARGLGRLHVVAPNRAYSCMSHGVTLDGDIQVERREVPGLGLCHCVFGTPADCVRLGLSADLIPRPDVVLSGINHGGNLGVDIFYSGTVAAVREAAILGTPAIACSQYRKKDADIDWPRAVRLVRRVLSRLVAAAHHPGLHWNVNLPAVDRNGQPPLIRTTHTALEPLPMRYESTASGDDATGPRPYRYAGNYQLRPADPGSDVEHVFAGGIAVTPLGLDLVSAPAIEVDFAGA